MDMEIRKPVAGEFYRHFKGKLYQVKMLARHSETGEEMVVYQGMYAPFACWVRPLSLFCSPVDRQKYPDISQKMRFEQVFVSDRQTETEEAAEAADAETVDDATFVRAIALGKAEQYLAGKITEQEIAERGVMQILDASTFHTKRQLMVGLKPYLDKRLLHNIAAALDIVLEEGELEEQFDSLLHCLDTLEHYEGGRLR